MNSFRFVEKALEYETERQTEVIQGGGEIIKETRGWDEKSGTTLSQRSKEEFNDYRYFPEPDLPPIVLTDAEIKQWRSELAQLPAELRRVALAKGLPYGRVVELQEAGYLSRLIEALEVGSENVLLAANWIAKKWENSDQFVNFLQTIRQHKLSTSEAAQLYNLVGKEKKRPDELVDRIEKVDTAAIEKAIAIVLTAHPDAISQYKAGEAKIVGFLIGQVMSELQGKGDAQTIKSLLEPKLTE